MNQFCGICAYNAVKRGVDYTPGVNRLADGTSVHAPVTTVNGTAVCWFHVADAALGEWADE